MSKKIWLNGKYGSIIGNYAEVDDWWYAELSKYTWYACQQKTKSRITYYACANINGKDTKMHRHIMGVVNRRDYIDHINRNTLVNTESNLRIVTSSQNQYNSCRSNKSGYKGVKITQCNKYQARITPIPNGKTITIGSFDTAKDAAIAYDIEAVKYFGQFARLNFPQNKYDTIKIPDKNVRIPKSKHKFIYFCKRTKLYRYTRIVNKIGYIKYFPNLHEAIEYSKYFDDNLKECNQMKVIDLAGKEYKLQLHHYIVQDPDTRERSSGHLRCRQLLKKMYPLDIILEEVKVPGENLIIDFLIPSRKMVVEVNGKQHYKYNSYFYKTKRDFYKGQNRDRNKQEWCRQNNLTYIALPDDKDDNEWVTLIQKHKMT